MTDGAKASTEAGNSSTRKAPRKVVRFLEWIAVVGIIGFLVLLLLPAVDSSRGKGGRREQCASNLRQIAIALRSYQIEYACLPPAYTVDADGKPLHSWRTLILPQLDQMGLYKTIDLSKPWNDPANKAAYDIKLSVYDCPSVQESANQTTYLAVVAPNGCFRETKPRKLSEITDDKNNTLMVIDAPFEHAVHWMAPIDANEEMLLKLGMKTRTQHPGGIQVATVDGAVFFLLDNESQDVVRALVSIDGNDDAVAKEARE